MPGVVSVGAVGGFAVEGGGIPAAIEDIGPVLYLPTHSNACMSDDCSQIMDLGPYSGLLSLLVAVALVSRLRTALE